MFLDAAILTVILATAALMWWPVLRRRATWRATITPLASIIGSGFLVLGPVLDQSYGRWAPAAMLALCAVAWGFGAAIRANIAALAAGTATPNATGETVASALLGFAYMISVAYYLNLFGAFAVSLTAWDSDLAARLVTTAVYAVILWVGWTRGFHLLERLEYISVSLKLAIISGLLLGLAVFTWGRAAEGALDFNPAEITGWAALTLGFGLIVTVQGFETSRYLGGSYDAPTRIRSMRLAQGVATLIYMVYIGLSAYSFAPGDITLSETAIIDMMAIVSPVLPVALVAAALAAQFSAAVADTGGAGGLVNELSRRRVTTRQAYALTAAIGITITWVADVFEIIAYASRAFAAYYAAQTGLAAWRYRQAAPLRAGLFAALAVLGLAIALFGTSVD